MLAPFVFAGAALAAAGSLVASPALWLAALLSMLAAVACDPARRVGEATPIAIALWTYAAWTIGNDLFGSAYSAAGIFNPMFLVAGFAAGRGGDVQSRRRIFYALIAGAVVLGLWGLWQAGASASRAHAHFETPNTLATVLNLALAPLVVRILFGETRGAVLVVAAVLVAALTATLSRGGFIALAVGLSAALLLFGARPLRPNLLRALMVLGAGVLFGLLALSLPSHLGAPPEAGVHSLTSTFASSTGSRGELYRLALAALGEHPWVGSGYLAFPGLLEAHRDEVPSYAIQNITYFVHDDYLQTLVELGLPGLATLLAIVFLPFWLARRSPAMQTERLARFAALAGIATMATHALGDFPFYVPVCLLGFGVLLGRLDAGLSGEAHGLGRPLVPRTRLAAIVAAVVLAVLILPPPLAEAAAAYGDRSWRDGKPQSAAYGLELARRLQPRDWRYHWYAGQFWYALARTGNAAAAPLADRAFGDAVAANPREPRPLLARLATQMRFARMLEHPQPVDTLRRWADEALALAPLNPAVRRDHAAAIEQLSRPR